VPTNALEGADIGYRYNKPHSFYSPSSGLISLFILLIFSLSISGLGHIVPQAIAHTGTMSSFMSLLSTTLNDSNQNRTAQAATKIYFERSGGFAGISISTMVDIYSLPPDEAHKIQRMIDNAKEFLYQPSKLPLSPVQGADYFKYKVSVETEQKRYTIETNDITMPSELRPLINYLEKKAGNE
jgi:hypothetical protein